VPWTSLRTAREQDPRIDYAGPLQNVNPAVHYLSDDRCADCHGDIATSFAQHSMGRSLQPVALAQAPPQDRRYHNPFQALGSQFLIERNGDRVWHRRTQFGDDGRPAAELKWEVH